MNPSESIKGFSELDFSVQLSNAESGWEWANALLAGLSRRIVPRFDWSVDPTGLFDLEAFDRICRENSFELLYEFDSDDGNNRYHVLHREGAFVLIENDCVTAVSDDREKSQALVEEISKAWDDSEGRQEGSLEIQITYGKTRGPDTQNRSIRAPSLADIAANYAPETRGQLEALAQMHQPDFGKIIILNGEPGTGKTYAIRALMQEWKSWCSFKVIMDPHEFFTKPDYMIRHLDRAKMKGKKGKRSFQLLVLDDADLFLAADAKAQTGDAVSRLLNMSDGIIGQGLDCLFLISTNQELGEINEAISRPGRTLANISFRRFIQEEAEAWIKSHGGDPEKLQASKKSAGFASASSYSLAELFQALRA